MGPNIRNSFVRCTVEKRLNMLRCLILTAYLLSQIEKDFKPCVTIKYYNVTQNKF